MDFRMHGATIKKITYSSLKRVCVLLCVYSACDVTQLLSVVFYVIRVVQKKWLWNCYKRQKKLRHTVIPVHVFNSICMFPPDRRRECYGLHPRREGQLHSLEQVTACILVLDTSSHIHDNEHSGGHSWSIFGSVRVRISVILSCFVIFILSLHTHNTDPKLLSRPPTSHLLQFTIQKTLQHSTLHNLTWDLSCQTTPV
jgi:hypothetical protein